MDIKIPSGPPEGRALDAVKDASDAVETTGEIAETQAAQPAGAVDDVSKIAEQVARGEIGRDEAIERLLNDTLGTEMVKAAPKELREELVEVLKAQLETDPYLKSLSAILGPGDSD